jgi:hypothetical protein
VTTDPSVALEFARYHRPGDDLSRPLAQYRIRRDHVLCDVGNLLRHGFKGEQELLVLGAELAHVRDLTRDDVARALRVRRNNRPTSESPAIIGAAAPRPSGAAH